MNKQQVSGQKCSDLIELPSFQSQSTCAGTPLELQGQYSQGIDIFEAKLTAKMVQEEEEVKLPSKLNLRKVQSAAAPSDSTFLLAAMKFLVPRPKPLALDTRQTKLTEFFGKTSKKQS